MRLPVDLRKLAEMVKQALKDKDPVTYRELRQSGNLEQFAGERAQLMKEAAKDLHYETVERTKRQAEKEKKNPIETVAMINMALHQVDEYVLATHLEFPTSQQDQEI